MKRTIRLCYRKIMDAASTTAWEQLVHQDTYTELLLQAQLYNPEKRYKTFSEIIHHVPGADKLHFLVSTAALGYLRQLNGMIPDVYNSLGQTFLPFNNFRFEIIASDMQDQSKHVVAINFYSDPLTWQDTVGNQLLISTGQMEGNEQLTQLIALQPFVSIYSIQ